MAFATMNASPPRTCRMRNAPPGKGKPHAKCSPLERENRMRNAPPGKEKHSRMQNALWKGKAQPHAKCPPLERKSTAACKMLPLERKSTATCEMPLLERKSTAACEMLPPGKGFTSN